MMNLSPTERLFIAVRDEEAVTKMLEDYADTEGVIEDEGARVFWQKVFFARLGHTPEEQLAGIEKLWVSTAYAIAQPDPALDYELCQVIDNGTDAAEALYQRFLGMPLAEVFIALGRLTGMVGEAMTAQKAAARREEPM